MGTSKKIQARSPEAKENYLISMAYKLAEERLKNGTASSQMITHFLKLGSQREELEKDRIRSDMNLAKAKIKKIEAEATSQELFEKALAAFASYSGQDFGDENG